MATTDIINRLDRDLFKDPKISQEELFRRLNALVETLYDIISQTSGGTIINTHVTTYAGTTDTTTGITITRVVFDVNGNTVEAKFENGKLIS
jgi:hypothetical protein